MITCSKCGQDFEPPEWQVKKWDHCCPSCRRIYNRDYYAKHSEKVKNRKYKWANEHKDIVKASTQKYRDKDKVAYKERKKKWYSKWYYEGNGKQSVYYHKQIRRAKVKMIEQESFKPTEIFERDNWKCQICGKRVSSRFKFPHPLSKSIDHIIPIAAGGTHTRRNVRLTHLGCNLRKSSFAMSDQLRIF